MHQTGSIAVSNGSVTVSGLAAGNFSLVVTDANGCVTAENGTITSDPNSNLVITPTVTPATCGNANGAISIVVTGNTGVVTYTWSGPAGTSPTGANPTGLPAGQYTVTVKDGDCEKSANITILNSNGPSVVANVLTNNVCSTDKKGSAQITISGNTTSYTYDIPGVTNGTASNNVPFTVAGLGAGTYQCICNRWF